MVLARIWHRLGAGGGSRRAPRCSDRRNASGMRGASEDAAELVADALIREPASVVGHLLAGSLHMALRESGQARTSFERVLALEPTQPRALLGLARLALEDGEAKTCRDLLSRALARYPDFPGGTRPAGCRAGSRAERRPQARGDTGDRADGDTRSRLRRAMPAVTTVTTPAAAPGAGGEGCGARRSSASADRKPRSTVHAPGRDPGLRRAARAADRSGRRPRGEARAHRDRGARASRIRSAAPRGDRGRRGDDVSPHR